MVTASQDVCDQKFFGSHEKPGTSSSASGIQEAATKRQDWRNRFASLALGGASDGLPILSLVL